MLVCIIFTDVIVVHPLCICLDATRVFFMIRIIMNSYIMFTMKFPQLCSSTVMYLMVTTNSHTVAKRLKVGYWTKPCVVTFKCRINYATSYSRFQRKG